MMEMQLELLIFHLRFVKDHPAETIKELDYFTLRGRGSALSHLSIPLTHTHKTSMLCTLLLFVPTGISLEYIPHSI